MMNTERYIIRYYSNEVQQEIYAFPPTLKAKYIGYAKRMTANGIDLGEPHTKAIENGLFELRLKGTEGIGRFFIVLPSAKTFLCCTVSSKKTQKTPQKDLAIAIERMKEIKNGK